MRLTTTCFALALASLTIAQDGYRTRIIARGLASPYGIEAIGAGRHTFLLFTQVPTPGVPGDKGGRNSVDVLNVNSGRIRTLHKGDPEPLNISFGPRGAVYWTCRSAGVILRYRDGVASPILTDLMKPTGIDVGRDGNIYFTQVPTPGVPGSEGGMNSVDVFDGNSIMNLSMGEPEPVDIAVDQDGTAYWTCKSAGVILKKPAGGEVSVLLKGLNKPVGIALNHSGNKLFFTEVPTPGVPGSMGGGNFVWEYDLQSGAREIVNFGDPEPTDVTVAADGRVFWTCTSAGVIVEARRR